MKQAIEEQVASLKQQKRLQGLSDKEFLRLKSLQGLPGRCHLLGLTPTRKKNRLKRLREHHATLRRRTISARAIERELHTPRTSLKRTADGGESGGVTFMRTVASMA